MNGDDLLLWQRNLGLNTGATNQQGDANLDGAVNAQDLAIWRDLFAGGGGIASVGRIFSGGVAGATNRISVPVIAGAGGNSESIHILGTKSINLASGFRVHGTGGAISSYLPAGQAVTIASIDTLDHFDGLTQQPVAVNSVNTSTGRVEINSLTGSGALNLGNTQNSTAAARSTIVLGGANTGYSGKITQNRSTLVLADDLALGTGGFAQGNPTQRMGFDIASTDDARKINKVMALAQYQTFSGEHSIEWAGVIAQDNSRGIVNLLPQGKTLLLSGHQYAVTDDDMARPIIYDGTGNTVITGIVKRMRYVFADASENESSPITASLVKQGTGALHLNGGAEYTGTTTVNGGNLTFGVYDGEVVATPQFIVNFGAIGADVFKTFGVTDTLQTNSFFVPRILPTSTGGLMINASEAGVTYDYTGVLAAVPLMSLGAPETGVAFTGSIVTGADNTYRLGGGGTLTLPTNQLTGARNLVATNGGVVQLNGANTYSGTTSAIAKYTTSLTAPALIGDVANNANVSRVYGGTVLAAGNLQNGGVPSSIGSSPSAGANLYLQGSTFRYTGGGASTDRLFSVGTGGATIEASGAGAVNFTSTSDLVMDAPAARTGAIAVAGTITGLPKTSDLVIGTRVSGPGIPANAAITVVNSDTSVTIAPVPTLASTDVVTFAAAARTLTLGGTNTDDNTLRPNIVNGAAATNVVKADGGKWILTGLNTYTGTTVVNGGTLLVNGTHTGGGAYTVAAAGTLGGTGALATTTITVNGAVSPGNPLTDGVLTVTGGATFNAGSTLLIELAGANPGDFDELNLSGALVAGGTFDVDLLGGYVPGIGASFDVLDFLGAATGSFSLSLPTLPAGRVWNTGSLLTTGTISVQAGVVGVPEPSSLALGAGALGLLAVRRRRRIL